MADDLTLIARTTGVLNTHPQPWFTREHMSLLLGVCLIMVTLAATLACGYYITRPPEFCTEVWHP